MADAYTTFAAMVNDAPNVYIATKMINLLDRILVTQKVADQYPLEQKNSKTLRVVRVERLTLPITQLVEGVTPSTQALTLTNVDVVVEQWGIVALLTDVVELTTRHPMMNIAIERTAMAMKETMEREDALVLMAGTNITYPGSVTTRANLASTDVFDTALAITIRAKLQMRGAPKYLPDGMYIGIMQPPHEASILASDQTFQQASNFSRVAKLEYGYIGPWMGIDWIVGNFLPVYVGVATPDTGAISATKAKYTVGTSGTLSMATYKLSVVAREVTTDYERRVSQTASISVTSPGSIAVQLPSSTNYTYDIYMSQAGGTTMYKVASRQTASSVYSITTDPAGTEPTAITAPANGVSVYPGVVCGKGAFGTCTLNGMSLQTFITPKGASDSDPLSQRRKVGAKFMRKSFILDNNFLEVFETSSGLSAVIPA